MPYFKPQGKRTLNRQGTTPLVLSWFQLLHESHLLFGGAMRSFFAERIWLRRMVFTAVPHLLCPGCSSSQLLCFGSWHHLGAYIFPWSEGLAL